MASPAFKSASKEVQKLAEQRFTIESSVHMFRCQLNAAMYGVVTSDNKMVVDAINEMEAFVTNLEWKTR